MIATAHFLWETVLTNDVVRLIIEGNEDRISWVSYARTPLAGVFAC